MTGVEITALERLIRSYEVRMRLKDVIAGLIDTQALEGMETIISGLSHDSRFTSRGDLFFAVQGTFCDGGRYALEAVRRGAVAVLSDKPIDPHPGVPVILVRDARAAKAHAAAVFYGHPSRRLHSIGVTGTNGKTTVCYMLKSILEQDGVPTGMIGTICHHIGKKEIPSRNTTPDPVELHQYLAEMVDENLEAAVMEVSSHALDQERVGELRFKAGVFTNLSREHLDYHRTMEEYGRTKRLLFESLGSDAIGVINADDPVAQSMVEACKGPVVRYGFSPGVDVTAELRRMDIDGFSMILKTPAGEVDVTSRLPGRFNVMNALAASAAAVAIGVPLAAVKSGFETLKSIKGRMESIDRGQDFRIFVDYAHTGDALKTLLTHLKPITAGKLITVFGCGGDRDQSKRPLMAEAATSLSDFTFITSDNPRSEDPDRIIEDILEGVMPDAPHAVEPDRRAAIQKAVEAAAGGDIVVIAGKGHENYQILKDGTIDFDDRRVAEEALWNRYH